MSDLPKTEQEQFWIGQFGDEYSVRNTGPEIIAANVSLFASIFSKIPRINSVIEFGPNVGLNLRALKVLFPDQAQVAVEINEFAANGLKSQCQTSKFLTLQFQNLITKYKNKEHAKSP